MSPSPIGLAALGAKDCTKDTPPGSVLSPPAGVCTEPVTIPPIPPIESLRSTGLGVFARTSPSPSPSPRSPKERRRVACESTPVDNDGNRVTLECGGGVQWPKTVTVTVCAHLEPELKKQAEARLSEEGMTLCQHALGTQTVTEIFADATEQKRWDLSTLTSRSGTKTEER